MKITLAYDVKIKGRNRKAGSNVKVDRDTGESLIFRGLARKPTPKASEPDDEQAEEVQHLNSERNDLDNEERE